MRRHALLAAVSLICGVVIGSSVAGRPSRAAAPGPVAKTIAVKRMTEDGKLSSHQLAVYQAARADGEGELMSGWKPPGDEWIVTVNGVQYRCTPVE